MGDNLFDIWASRVPQYDEKFRNTLFKSKAAKGSKDEESIESLGKHFSRQYELYIYAFFLGLYNNEFTEIPKDAKKANFSHHIQYWGSKNSIGRSSFTELQEYMFVALVAKTEIDFISLEKGEIDVKKVVKQLIHTMESYTNGGLILLEEKGEENSNYHLTSTAFLDLIVASKPKN
jgi:hypothetical protein